MIPEPGYGKLLTPLDDECPNNCPGCSDCSDFCDGCQQYVARLPETRYTRGTNEDGLCPECLEREAILYDCNACGAQFEQIGIIVRCDCGSANIATGLPFEDTLIERKQISELKRMAAMPSKLTQAIEIVKSL